jgi:hypothetical protein
VTVFNCHFVEGSVFYAETEPSIFLIDKQDRGLKTHKTPHPLTNRIGAPHGLELRCIKPFSRRSCIFFLSSSVSLADRRESPILMGKASGCNSILKAWDRCGGNLWASRRGKTSAKSSKIDLTGGAGVFGDIEGSSGLSRRAKFCTRVE